ncbi:hypothetical protein Q5762_33890 [Streptomyces sp. P9(2023)]|uniref:hypothetical protein n=1 Tax=Streptomyces sp. P9(2023) TaxID=3064394 RepID=UPI0028F44314|nr:hypothetical protein [Streptomyces sp. P9(2023)]MDT9693231.1 hypothetical protein [Streptomyces sp. P9(2023)]
MPESLPCRAPATVDDDMPPPYGAPSPGLVARAQSGLEKFLERCVDDGQAEEAAP